jgi:voltage-gated potassium channel
MTNCPFLKNALSWLTGLKDDLYRQQSIRYLLLLAFAIAVFFGTAVFIVDPNVHSLWDGIWYAWVTMTHVGYGDVVPTSFLGRAIGSLLILFSIALLGLFTATFSAILIGRDVTEVEQEESEILAELKRLHERFDKLEERK